MKSLREFQKTNRTIEQKEMHFLRGGVGDDSFDTKTTATTPENPECTDTETVETWDDGSLKSRCMHFEC